MTSPLSFSKAVDTIFPPNGINGCPDPATDAIGCYNYINNRREVIIGAANQKPLIRLADNNLNILTELTDELEATFEELLGDSGQAKVTIRLSHWLEDYVVNGISINQDLHILMDPIPTRQDWRTRWGGKVKEISLVNNDNGTSTIEFIALSHREHMKRLLFGANPIFPPEIQIPKMWILPGPLRSIFFISGFINLARIFVPGLSFITNIFNPAAWINPLNPDALLNFDPLMWPIQVAFVNPLLDTSMWGVLAATWTDWHSTMADLLANAGCMVRAYTWLTTDFDSPHLELSEFVGSEIRPGRNCVILSCEDKSGVTGPTGTALDGLLELIGVTLDDLITTVIMDGQSGQMITGEKVIDTGAITPLFQSMLGIKLNPPKVIWRDGQFTGMVTRRVTQHKGPPKTIMTGGRSPSLVNELQTFGIRYALSELSYAITTDISAALFGVASMTTEAPATPGLENIYQGQLDNVLLAWQRYTDPARALWTGEVAYQEYIERGTGSAYTIAGFLSLAEGHWKTRAFYGFEVQYLNGRPWVYGVDYLVGDRMGFEMDGIIYVDQLAAAKYQYSRKQPVFLHISVGDDKDKRDPVAAGMRMLQGVYALVGAFVGEGTLFG